MEILKQHIFKRDGNDLQLVCVCESEYVDLAHIKSLMEEYPEFYSVEGRFEMNLVRYVREAY